MKNTVFVIFVFLLGASVFGQGIPMDSVRDHSGFKQPGKTRYGLEIGSEFATFSGYGSGFSSWITPKISYNVNKRLTLGGGFSVINTNYFNVRPYNAIESSPSLSGNYTSAAIFVNGQYMINDRLSVFGSAYKVFPVSKEALPYNPFNPISTKGSQGIDFNIGYRVGKNAYIQAGFRYTDGHSPYRTDPFNSDPFRQGFSYPGVGSGFPGW